MQPTTKICILLLYCSALSAIEANNALDNNYDTEEKLEQLLDPGKEIHEVESVKKTEEQKLLEHLRSNYITATRPVKNASHPVVVKLGLSLIKLVDLDLSKKVITINAWLDQEWNDELMVWDPKKFDGIRSIRIPSKYVWLPDITLYNSDSDFKQIPSEQSRVMVYHDGTMFWPPPLRLSATCSMDITYFPFDTQRCFLKFGSWTYHGFQVDVTNRSSSVDLTNYVTSAEFDLVDLLQTRRVVKYSCCPEPYPDVTFLLKIQRKPAYYVFNLILPCIVISGLSLLMFFLPLGNNGGRLILGCLIFLSFSVIMIPIRTKIPENSESVPLIGIYIAVVMGLISISLVFTVVVQNFNDNYSKVPGILRMFLPKTFQRGGYVKMPAAEDYPLLPTDTSKGDKTLYPEVQDSLNSINLMDQKLEQKIIEDNAVHENAKEWKAIATQIDRILFLIMLTLTIVAMLILLVVVIYHRSNSQTLESWKILTST